MEPTADAPWLEAWEALEPIEAVDITALLAQGRSTRGDHLVRVVSQGRVTTPRPDERSDPQV